MQNFLLKLIAFSLLNVILLVLTMILFRSELPYLWFILLLVHIITLIMFPYYKFFKSNKNEKL